MSASLTQRIITLLFIFPLSFVPLASSSHKSGNMLQGNMGDSQYSAGKIVFCSDRDGNAEIYIMNNAKDDFYPAWSSDGAQIAYIAGRNRTLDICVMKADGSDKRYLTSHQALDEFPSWGPDGKHIVFESRRTGKKQIFIVSVDGTGLKQITGGDYNNSNPDWCKVPYSETALTANYQKKTAFPVLKGPYLGQKPPGKKAELFAPQIMTYEVHESPLISQDLREIFIGSMTEGPKYYKMADGAWSASPDLPFNLPRNYNGMFVSHSGKRIYFLIWEDNDEKFYFIERKGNQWTTLVSLGEEVNSFPTHWQFTTAKNENLYFSSGGSILVSVFDGTSHQRPIPLEQKNSDILKGGTPFIAPDESYLIYSVNVKDKDTDLYISYRMKNNKWSEPKDLGPSINEEGCFDLCPKISPDGKYVFFISRRSGPDFRIYWADAGFIEDLKPAELN